MARRGGYVPLPDYTALNELAIGESVVPRELGGSTASTTSTGSLRLTYFTARKSEVITQIRVPSGGTLASGLTLCRFGVYSIAANGDGTLIASIANDAAIFAAASTDYTRTLTAPFTKVAGQRYAVGVLQVGTTVASYCGGTWSGLVGRAARAPRMGGALGAQADLPASFTDASLSGTAAYFLADLLP